MHTDFMHNYSKNSKFSIYIRLLSLFLTLLISPGHFLADPKVTFGRYDNSDKKMMCNEFAKFSGSVSRDSYRDEKKERKMHKIEIHVEGEYMIQKRG